MGRQLSLDQSTDGDRVVVSCAGEIDLESSPRLLSAIQRAFETSGSGGVRIDLADVDYIDSSGIAVLVQGHKRGRKHRKGFGLRRPSRPVRELIELAQLHKLFQIEDGPE